LRYELGSKYNFEFVEGSIVAPRAKGVDSLAAANDDFFAYFHPLQPETLEVALQHLHGYLVEEGPFDGVVAFSQGSSLAASYMIQHQNDQSMPIWKFAILFSGEPGEFVDEKRKHESTDGIITIPTLHVWGVIDTTNPTQNALLDRQCCCRTKSKFVHQGAHEIPSSSKDIAEIVRLIRRIC
jgi:hypothetical protein